MSKISKKGYSSLVVCVDVGKDWRELGNQQEGDKNNSKKKKEKRPVNETWGGMKR